MADVLTIASTTTSPQIGTLNIDYVVNSRDMLSATVVSMDALFRPDYNDEVEYEHNGTRLFAGSIEQPDEAGHQSVSQTPIATRITAVDWNALPDRRFVEVTIPPGTLKSAVLTLAAYLAPYGVTVDPAQVDGPSLADPLPFERQSVTAILNALSVISGYIWRIDGDKQLSMFAPGATAAPFNLSDTSREIVGDVTVSPSLEHYANRVIVRYSDTPRAAYAWLQADANFGDGETVTIGSRTYTFESTLTNTAGNVQIGASTDDSLLHLAAAITLGPGAGTAYAADTTVHPDVTASLPFAGIMAAVALSTGVAGNSIGVDETASDARWVTEGGGEVTTLEFGADESLANIAIAEDVAAQDGGVNLREVVIDHPEIRDTATAQLLADGYLLRYVVIPIRVSYQTRRVDLRPGMQQSIVLSRRNLNDTFLIESVRVYSIGTRLMSQVTAVAGLTIPETDREAFRAVFGRGGVTGVVSPPSGSGTVRVLAAPFDLGGVDTASVPMGSVPAYAPVLNYRVYVARASFTGLVRVAIWGREAGTVTARLYDLTAEASAGQSPGVTDTSRGSAVTFLVPIVSGHSYRLELVGSTANVGVYGLGTLEAA